MNTEYAPGYFRELYEKFKMGTSPRYKIADGVATPSYREIYPTALASPEMLSHLPVVNYSTQIEGRSDYEKNAKTAAIWKWDLHAGVGSSVQRRKYLARLQNCTPEKVVFGAKGIDLLADEKKEISLAEFRIRQIFYDLKQGVFLEVFFQNILGEDTEKSGRAFWTKLAPELLSHPRAKLFHTVIQKKEMSLDELGNLTANHRAPAGHAFNARCAIEAAFNSELRPKTSHALLAWISNGEDVSPVDPFIVGQVMESNAAVSILFTEKTLHDRKGGMAALVPEDFGFSATVFETAQAQEASQTQLYEELGVRPGDQKALASTNVTIVHYPVLIAKLGRLMNDLKNELKSDELAIKEFYQIASPDVILNKKIIHGKTFTQLEGAMGSLWFNLDREFRKRYGSPLVQLIYIPKERRTRFFLPIKFAADFTLLFHSERFQLDLEKYRLIDQRPSELLIASKAEGDVEDYLYP